jgi:dsRNA-specific ribonuclease
MAAFTSYLPLKTTGITQSQFSARVEPLTMASGLTQDPNELAWLNQLRDFLFGQILTGVVADPQNRAQYVSIRAMHVWKAAFTHESYNPNQGQNYEVLEKAGDSAMKLAFTWYIMVRYPSVDQGQLSRFNDAYMAKTKQAEMSESLHLRDYIRTYLDMSRHVKEDAFESLFGGLFVISQGMVPGFQLTSGDVVKLGYHNCNKLLESIFAYITLDLNVLKGSEINQVKEIFNKMHWSETTNVNKEIENEYKRSDDQFVVELHFNQPFYDWVDRVNKVQASQGKSQMVVNRINTTFGYGVDYAQSDAKRKAYISGLEYLTKSGMTWEWADAMKKANPYWDDETKSLINQANQRAQSEGFTKVKFGKIRKGKSAYYFQLLAVNAANIKTPVVTIDASRELSSTTGTKTIISDDDVRKAALVAYIKYGNNPRAKLYGDIMHQ